MAYITQAEAAVYVTAVGELSAAQAEAYLDLASDMVDNECGRSFDTVLETIPNAIKMAVALLADMLADGQNAGRDITSERIGDYSVQYESKGGGSKTAIPETVLTLIAPYKAIIVG
jgi:hypothetical protein